MLPARAELSLRLKAPLRAPEEAVRDYPEFDSEELLELAGLVRRVPVRAYASDPARPADMTNVLLSGAEETVRAAFERAGWVGADGRSPASVGRTVKAIVVHDAYRRAPMSELLVAGRSPDLPLQKGGNSYEKRHHIRLWRYGTWRSNPLWVGAATHDIAVGLDWRRMRLTHRINARIDSERDKVVHDLLFTACADAVEWLERPAAPVRTVTATGEPVLTAGTTAALRLPACPELGPGAMAGAAPQWGNAFTRYLRRQVLVVRSDLLRANNIWSAYDVGRLAWLGIRGRRAAAEHWPTLGPATGPTGSPLPPD
ncbi:MAG: LssY C-terminal domain-containing protein [Bryobacterales bacterium]|nr:LssY C-terminal domain-containing protein [Bryobacterales bacterium]